MSEESDANFNEAMRKALIIRVQKNQDLSGTSYLSWFYVQQKSFEGLHSGKAIYKRNPESLSNIVNLANLSIEESDQDMAKEIWTLYREHQGSTVAYSGADLFDQNENRQGARQRFCHIMELSSLLTEYEISPLAYLCN
jgi:hypothetical protein